MLSAFRQPANKETPNAKSMLYWSSDCRKYVSIRNSTTLAHTKIPLRKWAIAIYLDLTRLKSISSMKLHEDIGVSQLFSKRSAF